MTVWRGLVVLTALQTQATQKPANDPQAAAACAIHGSPTGLMQGQLTTFDCASNLASGNFLAAINTAMSNQGLPILPTPTAPPNPPSFSEKVTFLKTAGATTQYFLFTLNASQDGNNYQYTLLYDDSGNVDGASVITKQALREELHEGKH